MLIAHAKENTGNLTLKTEALQPQKDKSHSQNPFLQIKNFANVEFQRETKKIKTEDVWKSRVKAGMRTHLAQNKMLRVFKIVIVRFAWFSDCKNTNAQISFKNTKCENTVK